MLSMLTCTMYNNQVYVLYSDFVHKLHEQFSSNFGAVCLSLKYTKYNDYSIVPSYIDRGNIIGSINTVLHFVNWELYKSKRNFYRTFLQNTGNPNWTPSNILLKSKFFFELRWSDKWLDYGSTAMTMKIRVPSTIWMEAYSMLQSAWNVSFKGIASLL